MLVAFYYANLLCLMGISFLISVHCLGKQVGRKIRTRCIRPFFGLLRGAKMKALRSYERSVSSYRQTRRSTHTAGRRGAASSLWFNSWKQIDRFVSTNEITSCWPPRAAPLVPAVSVFSPQCRECLRSKRLRSCLRQPCCRNGGVWVRILSAWYNLRDRNKTFESGSASSMDGLNV